MKNVNGKYIWLIGASTGIGAALAKELAARGAFLALSARSEDKLQALVDACGSEHKAMPLDVADRAALEEAASALQQDWPRIDSVIHLAALYRPGADRDAMESDFVRSSMAVNVVSVFDLTQIVLPMMEVQQEGGQFVVCGSVAGYRGLPAGQPYCATKAAVQNYAESLRVEYSGSKIDIKLISPGFVKTPLTDKNNFPMPMMIGAEDAAVHIANGLSKKAFEIHFPKVFTWIMKTIRNLPEFLYSPIARKMKP